MIKVTASCSEETISKMGVKEWPIWTCEESTFPWNYLDREICLLLEGDVTVTPDCGESVRFGAGDMVEFSEGLSCIWKVHKAVRKHYKFG